MIRIGLVVLVTMCSAVLPAHAQSCNAGSLASPMTCNLMVESSELLLTRAGIALSAGNPVAGASSTLGMRIGRVPRVTVAARVTGAGLDMPSVFNSNGDIKKPIHSVDVDAAVGIYSGVTLAPTLGGFGSLDVVGSAGKLSLPGNEGLSNGPASWALGARVGLLRESFTAPGISVTAMYRRIGDMSASDMNIETSRSFTLKSNSVTSVRGVIGKRLFVVGANAGVGYDSYKSDVNVIESFQIGTSRFQEDGRKVHRTTVFANATWTLLVLNFVVEGGIQRGGKEFSAPLPTGRSSKTDDNGYYGGLAVRLVL